MLIVIPIAKSDSGFIKNFSKVLTQFGPYSNHELLVVYRESAQEEGIALYKNLKKLFKKATKYKFRSEGPIGHPLGPNFYWKSTISYLDKKKNKLPWLWMETDLIPIKKRWLDLLEQDYKKSNKRFYGCLEDTTTVTFDKIPIVIGKHLVGIGIYPPDITKYTTAWKHVDRIPVAFDVLSSYEILPYAHSCDTIINAYHTKNYTKDKSGKIKAEDAAALAQYNVSFVRPITKKTLLHHGCKDNSFAELVLKGAING